MAGKLNIYNLHGQQLTIATTCCNLQKAMANHCSILLRNSHGMCNTSVIDNNVNGRILSKGDPSPGEENHGEQVLLNHHQVTV